MAAACTDVDRPHRRTFVGVWALTWQRISILHLCTTKLLARFTEYHLDHSADPAHKVDAQSYNK